MKNRIDREDKSLCDHKDLFLWYQGLEYQLYLSWSYVTISTVIRIVSARQFSLIKLIICIFSLLKSYKRPIYLQYKYTICKKQTKINKIFV